jgi:prepilin-type processing-associated H-X9-DG protein
MVLPPGMLSAALPNQPLPGVEPQEIGLLPLILPFMEANNLSDMIRVQRSPMQLGDDGAGYGWWVNFDLAGGATTRFAALSHVSTFECPSDSLTPEHTILYMRPFPIDGSFSVFSYFDWPPDAQNWLGAPMGKTNYLPIAGAAGDYFDGPNPLPANAQWQAWSGVFHNRSQNGFSSIIDGTSNTIFFGEVSTRPMEWPSAGKVSNYAWMGASILATFMYGRTDEVWAAANFSAPSSSHPGTTNFARADGSVSAIPVSVDPLAVRHIAGKADGVIFSLD